MDKRIIELKKKLIEENIEKIGLLSENGSIDFNIQDGIRLISDFDNEISFVIKMFSEKPLIIMLVVC